MTKREFRLLWIALVVRALALTASLGSAILLIWLSPGILTADAGDTAKALLVATVAIFSLAAKDMSEGIKRDLTEFVAALRSARASPQEKPTLDEEA